MNTRTKEVVLDYLKQTKMKRWCFMFTALLKKTGLNAPCLNPLQKNSQQPTHLWEQVISLNVTICKRIAIFCKLIAPVSSNARCILNHFEDK